MIFSALGGAVSWLGRVFSIRLHHGAKQYGGTKPRLKFDLRVQFAVLLPRIAQEASGDESDAEAGQRLTAARSHAARLVQELSEVSQRMKVETFSHLATLHVTELR